MAKYKRSHTQAAGQTIPDCRVLTAGSSWDDGSTIDVWLFPSDQRTRIPIAAFRKFCEEGLEICDAAEAPKLRVAPTGDEDHPLGFREGDKIWVKWASEDDQPSDSPAVNS
ncbi:hypothetical protein LCGC14_0298310 [marine sediment metagenome]|uniref:Uncharacterized protein n=1 Tax=marine sediment metagenome TaxID=412755 RepID=A0A0F9WCN2_9ZZZZ